MPRRIAGGTLLLAGRDLEDDRAGRGGGGVCWAARVAVPLADASPARDGVGAMRNQRSGRVGAQRVWVRVDAPREPHGGAAGANAAGRRGQALGGPDKKNMAPEVIDLEDDDAPPPPVSTTMDGAGIMVRRGRRRHLRFRVEMDRHDDNDNDDNDNNDNDDIVEIIVPTRMAVSSSSSSSFPSAEKRRAPPSWVGCIRDVFPLVSRSKVELLLAKAALYLATNDPNGNEEGAFHQKQHHVPYSLAILLNGTF
jgi:hypothetical protein